MKNGGGLGGKRSLCTCSLFLILCLFQLGVPRRSGAQESSASPQAKTGIVTLPELTITATRREQASFEVPQAVTIVQQREIARQTPGVLPDLLRGTTGVFVQETTPGQGTPILRGLTGSSVLMLVDGMRLNTAFFRPAPNQYSALVDAYNVDRLEVVRGAGSALYGSDALGGVVHIITPVPEYQTQDWQFDGRAIGRFASADLAGITRLSLSGGKQGLGFSAGLTYQNRNDRRDGGDAHVQSPSDFEAYAANGTLFTKHGAHDALLNVQYLRQPKTPRYDELVASFGQTHPSAARFFFEPNDRVFLHGRYRMQKPLTLIDRLEFHTAFQEINDDRRTQDFGSPLEQRERNRSRMVGVTAQLTSHWRDRLFLTYGAEVYLDSITSRRRGRNRETGERLVLQSRFANGATLNSFAGYVQSTIRLHPKLTAVLGGRVSYFDIDLPQADREIGVSLGIDDLTGQASLTYRLAPGVNLVANIGRGFRVPNVFDLSTFGPRPGNRFNIPNPNLKPERVLSIDAGLKWSFSRFRGEVFGFYSDFEDKIEAVPTGAVTSENRFIVQSRNLNSVRLFGIEASGHFSARDGWELFASLTYTWAEERFPNGKTAPASRIPPANGRVGTLYALTRNLELEAFLRFSANQNRLSVRDERDSRINPNGTPGWLTTNLRLTWEINDHVSALLAVENLFDKSYREHGSGINAPGLNAIVALEARFSSGFP